MNQGRAWEATQGLMLLGCQQARKEAETQTEPPLSPYDAEGLVTGIVPLLPFQKNERSSGALNVKRILGGSVRTRVSSQLHPSYCREAWCCMERCMKRNYFHLIHSLLGKCIKHLIQEKFETLLDIKMTRVNESFEWTFFFFVHFLFCLVQRYTAFLTPKSEYSANQ